MGRDQPARGGDNSEQAERNFAVAKQGADALVFDIAQGLRDVEGMAPRPCARSSRAENSIAKLVEGSGENKELLLSQAAMLSEFADTYAAQGDTAKRDESARKSLAIIKQLSTNDPSNLLLQANLAIAYEKVGSTLWSAGDLTQALENYRVSQAIFERLAKMEQRI